MKLNRFACILLVVLTGSVVGVKLPDTADFLPESTTVLVNVNDFSECREQFKKTRGIAGGAILSDGRVGLILDVPGLFEFCEQGSERFQESHQ